MSPHRRMSIDSSRKPTQIQDVFLGLAFLMSPPKGGLGVRKLEWSGVLNDGTGVIETEEFQMHWEEHDDRHEESTEGRKLLKEVLGLVRKIQEEKSMNIRLIAVADPVPDEIRNQRGVEFFAKMWLHLDAIPFVISPSTNMFTRLPAPSTTASATSAVSTAIRHLHPATHSATTADIDPRDHHVQVDCNHQVRLCTLTQYEESTSPELWKRFMALSKLLRESNTTIHFFSATPQGGGVALMRHALIRLWRLVGVNVRWFVPEGHPSVFDITKRKMHNVLQGVAPKDVEMSDEDKKWFEIWTEQNYESFWQNGALDAPLIVIDDPQLTALIPIIKKKRPNAKLIFRSHIQVQGDLTDDLSTTQHRTWEYLFNFIRQCDLFLAHPVKFFVPKVVEENMPVLYMAPSSDPLDGLNKPYGKQSINYYRQEFNTLSEKQCGVTMDWDREYICQVARFDPSKGTDWLLASFLSFRERLRDEQKEGSNGPPQLVIMGHGSVDDPDGTVIYEQIHDTLAKQEYGFIKNDVAVVRAPPSDSLLGCIMQGAWVATQLSTREGFEIKVTEAVNKRVPIIVSSAGGIPLQVKDKLNGWVVPTSDMQAVSDVLFDIYTGKAAVSRPLPPDIDVKGGSDPNSVSDSWVADLDKPMPKVHDDNGSTSEDFWTVGNATRWMILAARLLGLEPPKGAGEEDDEAVLNAMEVGRPLDAKGVQGKNVWEMVMGKDLGAGEGEIRWEGS